MGLFSEQPAINPVTSGEAARNLYGAMLQAGLGGAYPELKRKMAAIFDRVASLPWVPASWKSGVLNIQAQYPDDLVKLGPVIGTNGAALSERPLFLDTPEKLKFWQDMYYSQQKAIQLFAEQKNREGLAELDSALADAAFWDAAYKLAVTVRDAPGKTLDAVTGGVVAFVKNNFAFSILLVTAIGVGVWLKWGGGMATLKSLTKGK